MKAIKDNKSYTVNTDEELRLMYPVVMIFRMTTAKSKNMD